MKKIFILLITAGCIMVLGTAGGSDAGSITETQILHQLIIGAVLLIVGGLGYSMLPKKCKRRNTEIKWSRKARQIPLAKSS